MAGKKKKERKKRRSVATATAKRRERAGQGYSDMFELPEGTELFTVESAGTLRLDVVPYTVGAGNPNADEDDFYWERTFFIHRGIGVNDDWVICPARTAKKPCPVCELISKMSKDPDVDEDALKALNVSKRMLINVRNLKKDPDTVKVWHVSHAYFGDALDKALRAAYEDEDDNMDNFCDPEDGYYLKCVAEKGWQGKGFSIERVDFVARKEDLDDEILEQAVCLDDVLAIKDYDEIKEMVYSSSPDEDDDDDDGKETKKKKKKSKKSKKKKKKDEEEDDWDDDENWDDDEDGDSDDDDDSDNGDDDDGNGDDDDDDWDDDDDSWDDEEEEPNKSKKKKKKKKKKRRK